MKKLLCLLFIILLVLGSFYGYKIIFLNNVAENETGYLTSEFYDVQLYDMEYNESIKIIRGTKVLYNEDKVQYQDKAYYLIKYDSKDYYILTDNLTTKENDAIKEKIMYVRTPVTLYKNSNDVSILSTIKKGEEVNIIGYDYLYEDGSVHKYQVKYNDMNGYVYGKYLVTTKELALQNYDQDNTYQIHVSRGDRYGGGDAANLDYYPQEKPKFENNIMPDEVRSLYLNSSVLSDVDRYIKLAKESGINTFVVDIKDGPLGYPSVVASNMSKTSYDAAKNTLDGYKQAIKKLIDNGFYVIGRIVVFNDSNYVLDHKESAITDVRTGNPYLHNSAYWPSPYARDVWEYNVKLALEAVELMGFHEIQFDYVRFTDRTYTLESKGIIDLKNTYNEEKAQAIQGFLMYARDALHEKGVYISADVFGESAHAYVTGYGQYWPAISNVVDVISAMPYPDHFNTYDYGLSEISWTVPYKLLYAWGSNYAAVRQKEIATPAKVRTWIQAYNAIREPYIVYNAAKVEEQIKGLYDAGLTGGFITWNSSSNYNKYVEISPAFGKEYKK